MDEVIRTASQPEREQFNQTIRFWKVFLRVSLAIMGILFIRSIVAEMPAPSIDSQGAFYLLKITLLLYVYCWYFGCSRDLTVKSDVLVGAPKPTKEQVGVTLLLLVGFVFLFWVEAPTFLSVVFIVFLFFNVIGWIFLKRELAPFVASSSTTYKADGDIVGLEKMRLYEDYMFGRWQWWRFLAGFLFLIILAASATGFLTGPAPIAQDVLFTLVTLLAVLVLEVWIWAKRIHLKLRWNYLNHLNDEELINKPSS